MSSTPGLVNRTNQLAQTLSDASKKQATKAMNLQLPQLSASSRKPRHFKPRPTKAPKDVCNYCKKAGDWKKRVLKKETWGNPWSPKPSAPQRDWGCFEDKQGFFLILPLNYLGQTSRTIRNEVLTILTDTGATLSVLNPTDLKQPLPRRTEKIQMVGVSNKPLTASKSLSLHFQLGPLQDNHSFFLVLSAPVHLRGRDFLEKYRAAISFSQKEEIILKIDSAPVQPVALESP